VQRPVVFDLDDLCDRWDPWGELTSLKARVPGLKVTIFAIPALCSKELLEKYSKEDWIELAIHGYHHSTQEASVWLYDEAKPKMEGALSTGYFVNGFKAPGWKTNREVLRAAKDLGLWTAEHPGEAPVWGPHDLPRYVIGMNDKVEPRHGHTWDTMGNGPSVWSRWFTGKDEFKFVSEVVEREVFDDIGGDVMSWSHASQYGRRGANRMLLFSQMIDKDDNVVDFGGNDGFVATHRPGTAVVDFSKPRVAYARYVYGLDARHGRLEELPCKDKEFDWGFCSHTLEHVEDLGASLAEIKRVCKKGCFVVVPVESKEEFDKNPYHLRHHTHEEWLDLLGAKEISREEVELVCLIEF